MQQDREKLDRKKQDRWNTRKKVPRPKETKIFYVWVMNLIMTSYVTNEVYYNGQYKYLSIWVL